jgi:hypothetical protein
MKIDATQLDKFPHRGECSNCEFKAVLIYTPWIGGLDALGGSTPDVAPIKPLCVTCVETPTGCVSENLKHKRLDEKEYLVK